MNKCDFCKYSILRDGKLQCTRAVTIAICKQAIQRMEKCIKGSNNKQAFFKHEGD